jgi:uncharacterized protein with ParB-like and HNH nuclease domain
MEKNVYSMEEIFAGKMFTIPDYQRGYAWDKTQCDEILEDLDLLPDGFNHYTGTIVLHPNKTTFQDKEGNTYNGYDVVDGQQRITSLVILLKVIELEFNNIIQYKTLAKGLEKKYLKAKRLEDGADLDKLILNKDCKDFFKANILGSPTLVGPTILSHKRILTAKKCFQTFLVDKQKENTVSFEKWLLTFYNKISQRLKFGIYIVDEAAEVGVIFETMNNRGKQLSEFEKVKNYLLYLSTKITIATRTELAENINKTWSKIFERFMQAGLGTEGENQFLRAHWIMAYDYHRKNWDGSHSIKGEFNLKNYQGRHLDLLNDLNKYVNSLNDSSIAFADLEKPERESSFNSFLDNVQRRKVQYSSIKLNRTRTLASFRPLLIACRNMFPNDSNKYHDLVTLLEKFAFRVYNMHGNRADTGQSALFKLAYNFHNGIIAYEKLEFEIRVILNSYSKHDAYEKFWDFDPINNDWYHWGALKYLLYEFEEYLAGKNPVQLAWDFFSDKPLENTIEHILPQTPDKPYWQAKYTSEEIKTYLHDFGNLCLTYNNSSYSNKEFPDKKGDTTVDYPCYARSSLFQEREITKYKDWTVQSIEDRRKLITVWAKKKWFVDFSDIKVETDELVEEDFEEMLKEPIE